MKPQNMCNICSCGILAVYTVVGVVVVVVMVSIMLWDVGANAQHYCDSRFLKGPRTYDEFDAPVHMSVCW